MAKKIKSWLNILFLTAVLILPGLVFANVSTINEKGDPLIRLDKSASTYGPFTQTATRTTLASTLGIVIGVALSLLGIVFLIITILAGFKWMTAEGNETKVEQAKDSITRAVIGIIVVVSSYAIWIFIRNNFIEKV